MKDIKKKKVNYTNNNLFHHSIYSYFLAIVPEKYRKSLELNSQ